MDGLDWRPIKVIQRRHSLERPFIFIKQVVFSFNGRWGPIKT